jgi:DNA-binding response OmpR family regulator
MSGSMDDMMADVLVALVAAGELTQAIFSPRELVARIKAALRRLPAGDDLPDSQVMRLQHLRMVTFRSHHQTSVLTYLRKICHHYLQQNLRHALGSAAR